ncbi:polymorphic outer membrane protein middle domain-containing protein [Chlamydia trachomatis]|uniref:Probable outer membrane protein PmpF n=5 Tax=Chlamydia trachomatis TaxID=813 RepID=PMPF_CHLTR|nr:polymorphic outer membrane protein middle domain-containing protein [Chlamydia trachomatis]NP_220392.1 outer membrane protein PmpF [Chlamydia trachomatis D/UW-3/CX]P38008.2 RecName: Full=Probable outer membrane protein PmpF; AltName: Full=Polymorphic membrane protein F; Flags: Precursor [Chlamydia trachomatis D/UW-3/CX]AAC68468.1 Putative Outer Membrane Protein F [Chlamydia trachomatis D/UW-3/CX]AAX76568.1 polymorphic membrane protein F [Chlamydia trachomatis]AAX76570.1 polymorphic membrane
MIKRTSLSFACLSFFYLSTISILQANETDTLQFRRFTFSDREIQFVLDPASLITAQNIVLSNLQSNGTGACTISGNTQTQIFSNSVNTTADSGGAFDMVTTSFTASDNANLLFCNNYCTHNKGGGAIRSGGPIRFLNNQDVLFYNNISAGAKYVGTGDHNEKNRGGALYATTITLTGNRTLAFINNMSGDCGGAISADTQISITDTVKGILFENNHTLNHIPYTQAENMARGGAICSRRDLCSISNNSGPIVFNYNQGGKGGAISATRCVIDNNKERIIFSNNSSLGWSQSSSASNGGAIQTTQGFTLRNNKGSIYFDSNTATHAGGAINCGYIDIRDNGPVYFLNNSAAWGAAFNLSKPRSATNYIHTGTGDIVFNNNVVFTLDGNLLGKRKLFHINNNEITPYTLSLGAKKDTRIYFYDLFQWERVKENTSNNPPSPTSRNTITVNPETEFSGAVVFSYNQMSSDIRTLMGKEHNYIKEAPTTLKFGTLAIEDDAELEIFNIPFTQNPTSLLALGSGATLTVGKHGKLNITNLGVILPIILKEGKSPPCIRVNPQDMTQNTGTGQTPSSTSSISTPMIIFNGRLSIVDENYESVYDSMDLSRGKAEQLILSIETTNDGQLDSNWQSSLNTSLLSPPHYGYQGLWTPNWITTTYTITLNNNSSAPTSATSIAEQKKTSETFTPSNTTTASIPNIKASAGSGSGSASNSGEVTITKHTLVVNWAPVGYIVDPIRRGDLIANSLVHSGRNMTMGLRSLLPDNSWFALQGAATTLFTKQQKRLSYHGYSSASKGYTVSSQASGAHGHKFLLSFSQSSDKMKEKETNNRLSSRYYLSALCFEHPMFDRIALIGAAACNYGTHNMRSFYGTKKSSKGKFHSTTLGASLRCELRDSMPLRSIMLTPFAQALFSRTEPASIRESGDLARLFTLEQAHTAVVSPIGIKGAYSSDTWPTLSWEMELAYQPTLYWKRPLLNTLLIQNNGSWVTTNTPLAKHSFYGRGSHSLKFSHLKLFANYQAEVATSTVSHYINAGGALVF